MVVMELNMEAVFLKAGAVAEEHRLEEVHNRLLVKKMIKDRMISHGLHKKKRKKKRRLMQKSFILME
jgi:hypothetical protein